MGLTSNDDKRLIEVAFPLKRVSLDSVHEKNVRHGHISTLHIWPARRPLAACRAALICTLLPDPGNDEERREIMRKLAGKVVEKDGKETTQGGILHWGREDSPDLDWFREKIREAYDGEAPKVLDPFAGGGAIPLEAMRLGCEATAIDINPVAWFILKCTLEYPQKLAGETRPLPDFALEDPEFMDDYLKSLGYTKAKRRDTLRDLGLRNGDPLSRKQVMFDSMSDLPEADLAWHVRAWGRWVLDRARRELAEFYPVYASLEAPADEPGPICDGELRLVPLTSATENTESREDEKNKNNNGSVSSVPSVAEGTPDIDALNEEYDEKYLEDTSNPRWVSKPTVAYLWARTVPCKNCRATVPLLKTQWLCKKKGKRVRLELATENTESTETKRKKNSSVSSVPSVAWFAVREVAGKQEFETDGTMSRSGATCPLCGTIMKMADLRAEGKAGHLGQVMTAVVVDGLNGKEYRLPTDHERDMAEKAGEKVDEVFEDIPFGVPDEPLPSEDALGMRIPKYGFKTWGDLFTPRQLLALGTFVRASRSAADSLGRATKDWSEAICAYMAIALDKMADRLSTQCIWICTNAEKPSGSFGRFALPITWDFVEVMPWCASAGGYEGNLDMEAKYLEHAAAAGVGSANSACDSATQRVFEEQDVILTDPPYYDAIPYSDLMDFFYVWLRRTLSGLSGEIDGAFSRCHAPKWDGDANDGELIEDESRFEGDKERARQAYEQGMAKAFQRCQGALKPDGRMGLVFANKQPDAWETLASALIRAGFVVDASWPMATERVGRIRAQTSAALSSSVWLICRKRSETARPGWDGRVLEEMREKMTERLRDFWDAGIRGPDFVWAATGPALEAYSKHPVVKKANAPGEVMSVGEFLQHVRRFVVDFQVGRVLSGDLPVRGTQTGGVPGEVAGLDDASTYYLLHRNDFGMESAPAGAVILYALSCSISDSDLAGRYDILEKSGSNYTLKGWDKRGKDSLGYKAPGNGTVPMVDQVHRLMHLWRAGDVREVDAYVEERGLGRNELFHRFLQALIELAPAGSQERSLLESISNHLKAGGTPTPTPTPTQGDLGWD